MVENLFISFMIGEVQDILDKTSTLRENVFYLISFKHSVNKNEELVLFIKMIEYYYCRRCGKKLKLKNKRIILILKHILICLFS